MGFRVVQSIILYKINILIHKKWKEDRKGIIQNHSKKAQYLRSKRKNERIVLLQFRKHYNELTPSKTECAILGDQRSR